MFGHSLGGATAAKAMAADARISAGINLDGSIFLANPAMHQDISKLGARLAEQLGDRAFMIMTHHGHDTQQPTRRWQASGHTSGAGGAFSP